MKTKMTRDAGGLVLSLECDKGDDFAYVDAERVQRGDLDSFLPFACWKGKRAYEFAYRVGTCVSLDRVLAAPVDFTYLQAIALSLLRMMRQCEDSGLSRLRVMFDLEHVFLDYGTAALRFVYVPMSSYASPGGESEFLIRFCRMASVPAESQPFVAAIWDYACRTAVITSVGFEAFLSKWGMRAEARAAPQRSRDGSFAAGGARGDKGWDFVSAAQERRLAELARATRADAAFSPDGPTDGDVSSGKVSCRLVRISTGVEFHLERGLYTLGRSSECSIALPDAQGVSRRHAELAVGDRACEICDLNSTNGVFVNGERIAPGVRVRVQQGDCVAFGNEEFLVDAIS